MKKQLFIHLPATDGELAHWVLRDDSQPQGRLHSGSLDEATALAAGARVIALVPGSDVLLTSAELPGLGRQRLARAVPFALEERLADDVETLHVALGQRDDEGRLHNAVVSRERLENWMERCRAAGLQVDVMTSEVLGLPREMAANDAGPRWILLVREHQFLLRSGEQQGLAVELEALPVVLAAALDEAGERLPSAIEVRVYGNDGFADSPQGQALAELCAQHALALDYRPVAEADTLLLARGYREQAAINLLQGDYSRRQQLAQLLRPWRPALVLLGLWLALQLGAMGIEYQRLAAQNADMGARITALYREAFPEARKVVNPRVQMERKLEKLRAGGGSQGGLLPMLAKAGPVIQSSEGLKLRNLRYKDGHLDLDLEIGDLQALDRLKQGLGEKAGMAVEIVSASARDGKVESRLALRPGGGK